MATAHERAVRASTRTGDRIKHLFAKMGTREHPRGSILSAYRTARRVLKGNLKRSSVVTDALNTLNLAVTGAAYDLFSAALYVGMDTARDNLQAYGLPEPIGGIQHLPQQAAWTATLGVVDAQADKVRALTLAEIPSAEELILGDGGRLGFFTPAPVTNEMSNWITSLVMIAFAAGIWDVLTRRGVQDEYMRQAVACVDLRTTQTCLMVHGQVVGLEEPFKLEGTPRFADEMMNPGFHWYCRTSVALVHRDYVEDDLTTRMRQEGEEWLRKRQAAKKRN